MGLAGYKISANRDTGNSAPFSLPNNRNNKTKTISDNEEKSRHICKVHIAASQVLRTFYCRPDISDKTKFLSMINLTNKTSSLGLSSLLCCHQPSHASFAHNSGRKEGGEVSSFNSHCKKAGLVQNC